MKCMLCPRRCGRDREREAGLCRAGEIPLVARCALHLWEEPPISGGKGSGAVFFSGCNLSCVFCQNYDISAQPKGVPCPPEKLCELYLSLQEQGALNINLVTPTPHLRAIRRSLELARQQGLKLPIVYNTNGYELVPALKSLEGLIDIYLPDLKYFTAAYSEKCCGVPDYFEYAAPAILEMQRQVGSLQLSEGGIARKGLLVRHLVLPGAPEQTRGILRFIAQKLPRETHLSLMRQYTPMYLAAEQPEKYGSLSRRLKDSEYERMVDFALSLGLENLYTQEKESASDAYTPAFDGTGV